MNLIKTIIGKNNIKKYNDRDAGEKCLKHMEKLFNIMKLNDPLSGTSSINEYVGEIYFYGSKEKIKNYPLKTINCLEEISEEHFRWCASLEEYNSVYNTDFLNFLYKEIFNLFNSLYPEKIINNYKLIFMKYEETLRILVTTVEECIDMYGKLTTKVSENALKILKEFMCSVEETKGRINDHEKIDELIVDEILYNRLEFELEYINRYVNNNIPELFDKSLKLIEEEKNIGIEETIIKKEVIIKEESVIKEASVILVKYLFKKFNNVVTINKN